MSSVSLFFHSACTTFGLEKDVIDIYSISLTRGLFSTWITHYAYDLLSHSTQWTQKYPEYFLLYTSYLVYDSTMTLFQAIQMENTLSIPFEHLFFHWILLFLATIMDYHQQHSLVLYLGLSHGIYILSGFELCFQKFHSPLGLSICNLYSFIYHLYRSFYIFPSMLLCFNIHTHGKWLFFSLFASYIIYRYEICMIRNRQRRIFVSYSEEEENETNIRSE